MPIAPEATAAYETKAESGLGLGVSPLGGRPPEQDGVTKGSGPTG